MAIEQIAVQFSLFTVHWTKISYWGHNKTTRGMLTGNVYCHGISLSGKIRCLNSKLPKIYRWISASSRYIERKSAIEGEAKPREGYRYTVYCHGIPLSGKNTMSFFILTEFLTYVFSSSSKKSTEQHNIIHPLSRVIHWRATYMTTYVRIIARNSQQTTQSTRDAT